MTEMIDRVAKAVKPLIRDLCDDHLERTSDAEDDAMAGELATTIARAAIEAMRRPTDSIREKLEEFDIYDRAAWSFLIDAALE